MLDGRGNGEGEMKRQSRRATAPVWDQLLKWAKLFSMYDLTAPLTPFDAYTNA